LRLIGFPHGGGGPQAFREWGSLLTDDIELIALNLPGRGSRLHDPLIADMAQLAPQVLDALRAYFDKPFAFFGHSVGAIVAYEVARALQQKGFPLPLHLFVSAHQAPHVATHHTPMYDLPDAEFATLLRELGLVPEEALSNEGLLDFILPPLKADFQLSETYDCQTSIPLSIPITALGGRRAPITRRPNAGRSQPQLAGRWSRVAELVRASADPTQQAHARALVLLERYGVVTREAALAEELPGGFSHVAAVLRAMEEAGRVRRVYFVEGLGGAQFALPGALDRLRAAAARSDGAAHALSAIDPANPFGVLVPWPDVVGDPGEAPTRPRRAAGALVVLVAGAPVLFLEKGGRKLTLFPAAPDAPDRLPAAVEALRQVALRRRRPLRLAELNGKPALRSSHAGALEKLGFRVVPGALVLDPR
jgi:surfactin synthase thioesterase subunit